MKMDFMSPEVTQSRSSKVAIPTTTFNRTFPSFQAFKAYKQPHSTLPSLPSTSKMSSVNVCTQAQLDAAMDAIWADLEARYNTIEDVKARLTLELWGAPAPVAVASPVAEMPSEAESEKSDKPKKGRKAGPMTEEAKAKMVAKRAATIAAKAAAAAPAVVVVAPAPEPEAKPLKIKVPKETKVKLTKEERSAAAKARYAALSDEGKAAIRERLVNAKAAAKAAKAAAV